MKIVKERTRLIFSEYTEADLRDLKQLVSTIDNTFIYEDEMKHLVYLPVGIQPTVEKTFRLPVADHSTNYWQPASIADPIGQPFEPRNQMQTDSIEFTMRSVKRERKVGLILPPGSGKALANSTMIPTVTGMKPMGDLKVGDMVFGSDGKPVKVTGVYPQGERDIYRVMFNDGRCSMCDKNHLWNLIRYDGSQTTKSLEEIMPIYRFRSQAKIDRSRSEGVNRQPFEYRCRIPTLSSPVEYDHQELSVHPYVIGALIGNGCLMEKSLSISSGDSYVPGKIASLMNLETYRSCERNYTYLFRDPATIREASRGLTRVQTKDFLRTVPSLIGSKSSVKIIPSEYMYNDPKSRLQLLQGLFDTDGSISYAEGRCHTTYSSCSRKLLEQIQYLIRSFGYGASISDDKRTEKYRDGYHGHVIIRAPIEFKRKLFTHPSKRYQFHQTEKNCVKRRDHYSWLTITDIQYSHREEATCITVDAPDKLFLTEDFIITHNTYVASYCAVKAGLRTLIIAPTTGVRDQWADSLISMVKVDPKRVRTVSSVADLISFDGDFAVTLQSTLSGMIKKLDLERLLRDKRFGTKIIDEAHMFFNNIIRVDGSCNFKNNWYLTATFGRSNEEEDELYHRMFGDIDLFRVKDKKPTIFNRKPGDVYGQKPHMNVTVCWLNGGLNREQIGSVAGATRYGISLPKYTDLIIPTDGTRTKFVDKLIKIVHLADKQADYGRTLILVPTINSVETVADHLRKEFPNRKIGTIHSKNDKAANDRVKAEDEIIISTVKSSGTGFDVKDLAKLIVAEQFKSAILAEQVSGRLRRRPDGKDTYMYDIVDRSIRQLRVWGAARSQFLKRKSKKFTVTNM